MPSPGAPAAPRSLTDDTYLELLADTLAAMDTPARSQFLHRYFRNITHLDLRENQCLEIWNEMLARRRKFAEQLGQTVSLKTILMDVLSSFSLIRVPVIIEYEELKRLEVNAATDPLTGLYNRRLFSEYFEKELNRARRYGHPLGILILDLHRFKEVNDRYGHPRGDEVLRAAAATLQKALRTSDSAFRIGGDEFSLLLPQTDAAQALALGRRIETVFAELLRPLHLAVSVSLDHGVATFPQDGDQSDLLIRVADERLYRVKHASQSTASAGSSRATSAPSPTTSAEPPPKAPPGSPISISAGRLEESEQGNPSEPAAPATTSTHPVASAIPIIGEATPSYSVQRKAERVSMVGTNAYAVIGEHADRRARVIDLGFGGVALEFEQQEALSENILAILHVPILPPVRVLLKPVWSRRTQEGAYRLGCHFVS
jgi:diguanylate cyclase (GGDEF)-like protein